MAVYICMKSQDASADELTSLLNPWSVARSQYDSVTSRTNALEEKVPELSSTSVSISYQ